MKQGIRLDAGQIEVVDDVMAGVLRSKTEKLEIPYPVTGPVASMACGEPRLTNDIDIVAEIKLQQISALVSASPADEYYISENMIKETIELQGRFNIIHPGSGLSYSLICRFWHGNCNLKNHLKLFVSLLLN